MSSLPPTRTPRALARRAFGDTGWTRTRAVLSLGMVFGLGAVGTMAAWSDTATATTGTFSTSSVNVSIKLNSQHPVYAFTSLKQTNLSRGASVAGMLPVNNTGDTDFDYTVAAVTADAGTAGYGSASAATLAQNLTTKVFTGASSDGTVCSGGTEIASKALALNSVNLIESARRLAVNNTDQLCFQVTVNPNAPIGARMSAVGIDFVFAATQA